MINNKKSIALMLAVASVASIASFSTPKSVYASEYDRKLQGDLWTSDSYTRTDKNGVTWDFSINSNGEAFIKGAYNISKTIEVPQEIDGCSVVGILQILKNETMDGASTVEKVILPSTVKLIGNNSFRALSNLKDINIPSGVEYFGFLAFPENWINSHKDSNGFVIINNVLVDGHNCSGEVTIPSNVTTIGNSAFGKVYKHGAFGDYKGITGVTIPSSVKKIDDGAFYECNDLKNVNLAEGIEEIGASAFGRCTSLKEIKIPKSIKSLSIDAFKGNDSIKIINCDDNSASNTNGLVISSDGILLNGKESKGDIVIPSNVKEIQAEVFQNNDKITSVKISGNAKIIKERAFMGCSNLKKVTFEEGINSIGSLAFSSTGIKSIYLPDSIQAVGDKAFSACKNLEEASVGKNKPSGIEDAFLQCLDMEFRNNNDYDNPENSSKNYNSDNLVIKDGVLVSGKDAKGDVEIPSSVSEIEKGAFKENDKITSIKLPGSVYRIGDEAFYKCSNLKNIKFSEGLIRVGDRAFSKTKISKIYLPPRLEHLGKDCFEGCTELENVSVAMTPPLGIDSVFANCLNIKYRDTENKEPAKKQTGTLNEWNYIDGKWYYLRADGSKQTGWFWDERYSKWYFLGDDGVRQTGWIYYKPYNSWFYLDTYDGARLSGWFYDPNYGSWFFLNDNGTMKIGWMYDYNYGEWFYLNGNGTMRTGWFYDSSDGHWYYLYSNGVMARNTRVGGYYLNSSGAWVG